MRFLLDTRVLLGWLDDWLERATPPPGAHLLDLTPAVSAAVAALPDTFHLDPADRIIVAAARVHRATLLTCDRRIVDGGVVPTPS